MTIETCTPNDFDQILALYANARQLQTERKVVVWPEFDPALINQEIAEGRQFKIVENNQTLCNWAVTFEDKEIWEERDQNDAIYIHRICTNANFRGFRNIDLIVDWAKKFAKQHDKKYVRLDTLGNNTGLIKHYTSAGFDFLGIFVLTNVANLPKHYHDERNCCLFQLEA